MEAVDLGGVPETALWTLYHRAVEARRSDAVLVDPAAVELVDAIGYPFAERFGGGSFGQWQALRALTFDRAVRRFAAASPAGTVVALGEGLETQFWRVDDGRLRWLTVDLPEIVAVRERLLPSSSRQRAVSASVLDPGWMDAVPAGPVLFTAQGLLMYLRRADVLGLVSALAARFARSALVFDAVPEWLAERSRSGKLRNPRGYVAPAWHWSLAPADLAAWRLAGVEVRRLRPPRGRGAVHGALLPLVQRAPRVRDLLLTIWCARFPGGA